MNGLQNYSNLEKFHDGSNNQVYRARRVSDKTPVVIKIPRSEYPSSRELARLYNEYHLLNELQLPGIARVYGLEKFGRTVALVMESLEGQSLNSLLNLRQLTISECLTLAVKLTQLLEAVHARQIVHRDIKP
ncbi:MAG TPA: protein kinase, partial [Pseudomonadota bacterium]|nr:protein kinase [Pseudomonadota bacterium]